MKTDDLSDADEASPAAAARAPAPLSLGKRLRYALEYLGLRAGHALVRAIPLNASIALAGALADLSFACMPRRRATAIENIRKAGIAPDATSASRLARASFRHFAILMVESIVAESRITADNWAQFIDVSEAGPLMDLVRVPEQSLIVATAHFGNWEVAGQVMSQFKPLAAVARRMNNPYSNGIVQGRKTGHAFRTILREDAKGSALLGVLRGGQLLAMLIDQHARYRGMLIPFLGRPAATNTSAAILHLRSGVPLCFAYCVRLGPLRYKLVCPHVFRRGESGQGEDGILTVMEGITRMLEEAIRRHPEQYLWAHRRWRYQKSRRLRVPAKYAAMTADAA